MPEDSSTPRTGVKNGLLIGLGYAVGAATVLLVVRGTTLFQGATIHNQPAVFSGASVQINVNPTQAAGTGRTVYGVTAGSCTGTGGVAGSDSYLTIDQDFPTADMSSSASGALVKRVTVDFGNVPVATQNLECGFDTAAGGTGATTLTNFTDVTFSTGSIITFSTGSVVWRASEDFQCGISTDPTSALSCLYYIEWMENTDPN